MNKKEFNEMVAFDFSNLNLEQNGNDNCFTSDNCDSRGCDCDICDGANQICDDGTCNSYPD